MTTTTPDPLADAVVDDARSTLPIYVVADSPDGQVLSHSGDYPEDDTLVWLAKGGSDDQARPMGDLYAEYGDDLVAYADPEEVNVVAALYDAGTAKIAEALIAEGLTAATIDGTPVTAAQDAPERTADGEVVIRPDAPPDPKLALSTAAQEALNAIPGPRSDAEARGDDAAVAAWDRYAEALRSGKTPAEARKAGWPDGDAPAAITAAVADQRAVTAALGNAAMDTLEAFLTDAEDRLGITAALNGPGVIPRPVQRKAVGENPDAQAQVVAAFEANYRDDVTEFIEDVLGPRPDPDTPEHDAEAWDALAREARLWHARRLAHGQ